MEEIIQLSETQDFNQSITLPGFTDDAQAVNNQNNIIDLQIQETLQQSNEIVEQQEQGFVCEQLCSPDEPSQETPIKNDESQIDQMPPKKFTSRRKAPSKSILMSPNIIKDIEETPVKGRGEYQFIEDLPLNFSTSRIILENPEENQESNTEQSLEEKLKSKNWRCRSSAFQELISIFESQQEFNLQLDWSTLLNDNNPSTAEKALQAFLAHLSFDLQLQFDAKEITKVLIDKGFNYGKLAMKKCVFDILFFFIEKKDKNEIFESLVSLLQQKNSKLCQSTIIALVELLAKYGIQNMNYLKPFLPEIEKLACSSISQIRNDCMILLKEATKFLGDSLISSLQSKLKRSQIEELERFLKEWQHQNQITQIETETLQTSPLQLASHDSYEKIEGQDIFQKFNEKWCETVSNQQKWNEKIVMLEDIIKAATKGTTKIIASSGCQNVIFLIKKLLNESNANVNIAAIKLSGLLSKGLRKQFHLYAKQLFPVLVIKLRDKKFSVVEETRTALEMFHYSIGLEEVTDDLMLGLNDKASQVKIYLLEFIQQSIESRQDVQLSRQKLDDALKQLLPIIRKMLDDSGLDVRQAALLCIGKIKPFLSGQLVNSYLNDLSIQKMQKIIDISNQDSSMATSQYNVQVRRRSLTKSRRQPSSSFKDKSVTRTENENEQPVQDGESELIMQMSGASCQSFVSSLAQLQRHPSLVQSKFESIVSAILSRVQNDLDNSLISEAYNFLSFCNHSYPKPFTINSFSTIYAFIMISINFVQFKIDNNKLLQGCCETIALDGIFNVMIAHSNNPANIPIILNHFISIIESINVTLPDCFDLFKFVKSNFEIHDQNISELNKQLFQILYKLFGQQIYTSFQESSEEGFNQRSTSQKQKQEYFIDITQDVQKVLVKLSDEKWQKRKEAIEELEKLFQDSKNQISPTCSSQMFQIIKVKLCDQNKGTIKQIIGLIGRLAEFYRNKFLEFGQLTIPVLISYLGDKVAKLDAFTTLERISEAIGSEQMLILFSQQLTGSTQEAKSQLMKLILKNAEGISKCDLKKEIVHQIANCFCDKVKEIKTAAQLIIEKIIEEVTLETFKSLLVGLKPTTKEQVKTILKKYNQEPVEQKKQQVKAQPLKQVHPPPPPLAKFKSTADLKIKNPPARSTVKLKSVKEEGGLKTSLKPIFQDQLLVASFQSIKDHKNFRINLTNSIQKWESDQFDSKEIEETFENLKLCVKSLIYNNLISHDYRSIIQGLSLFLKQVQLTQGKCLLGISDLLLKWILIKIFGGCVNVPLLQSLLNFFKSLINYLEKQEYQLSQLETILSVRIICELILIQIPIDENFIKVFISISDQRILTKYWIQILRADPQKSHFSIDDNVRDRYFDQALQILENYLMRELLEENIAQLLELEHVRKNEGLFQKLSKMQSLQLKPIIIPESPANIANLSTFNTQSAHGDRFYFASQRSQTTPRSKNFQNCLNELIQQGSQCSMDSLMQFIEFLNQSQQEHYLNLLINNNIEICQTFNELLNNVFASPIDSQKYQYVSILLQVIQKLFLLKTFTQTLNQQALLPFLEDIIIQLLRQDDTKLQNEYATNLIKQLNSVILRILENANINIIFSILIALTTKYQKMYQEKPSKIINLLLKCTLKLNKDTAEFNPEQLISSISSSMNQMNCFDEEEPILKNYKCIVLDIKPEKANWQSIISNDLNQILYSWVKDRVYDLGRRRQINEKKIQERSQQLSIERIAESQMNMVGDRSHNLQMEKLSKSFYEQNNKPESSNNNKAPWLQKLSDIKCKVEQLVSTQQQKY